MAHSTLMRQDADVKKLTSFFQQWQIKHTTSEVATTAGRLLSSNQIVKLSQSTTLILKKVYLY